MNAFEEFYMYTKLTVNNSKTRTILVNSQKEDESHICILMIHFESVESFKYLDLEVPSNHKYYECATCRLKVGKRAYYAFENTCNHEK